MEISDLRVFRQVVASGGITRAAEVLHRVPSNVTARIQKLEEEVGKPLFIRDKKRLNISSAGEQLLDYAHRILDLADQALEEIKESRPSGQLKVGAMEAVAATRLVYPTMKFHERYPDLDLQIHTGATGLLIEHVLSEHIDLAFVADPGDHPELESTPVYNETLVLISDKQHEEISKPQDLGDDVTMLGFNHQCAYRNILSSWLRQDKRSIKVVEISSYHALLNCAAAGMGIGIVPKILLDQYPFKEHIKCHNLPAKWRKSVTAAIWKKGNKSPAIEAFLRASKESNVTF